MKQEERNRNLAWIHVSGGSKIDENSACSILAVDFTFATI
jgi:hypothetical protein